jgi:hypothetical protein
VGGIGGLVRDEDTGILVPERDTGAISDAVCRLLADTSLRKRLGRAGRAFVREHFDQAIIAKQYAEVLFGAANRDRNGYFREGSWQSAVAQGQEGEAMESEELIRSFEPNPFGRNRDQIHSSRFE